MKSLLSVAALLALTVGVSLSASAPAEACGRIRCHRVYVAPVVVPVVPVAPVVPVVPTVAVPAPNPIPHYRRRCCRGYYGSGYVSYVYPSYTYPGVAFAPVGGCGYGYGITCYPRRDCWYDGYGRRFCN